MEKTASIADEPVGEVYKQLLGFASRARCQFSLVWREQLEFEESACEIASRLKPDLMSEIRTDEWPGTRLIGHMATVRTYQLSGKALAVLSETHGLYDWRAPSLPEDLAFYTSDGSPWLGSIAHERDAFIYRSAIDVEDLKAQVPGLRLADV